MKHPKTWQEFKNHPYVSMVSDERSSNNGYWIYLKEPYFCNDMDLPSIHEYSIKECSEVFKSVSINKEYWKNENFYTSDKR